jgi:hypothetical protein
VGVVVGRCAWEAVYSTNSPSNKLSFAASTLRSLALASCVDWGAASRRWRTDPSGVCPVCKRTGVMC